MQMNSMQTIFLLCRAPLIHSAAKAFCTNIGMLHIHTCIDDIMYTYISDHIRIYVQFFNGSCFFSQTSFNGVVMRLPGGGFSFRVERNAGWLLFLLQVGWFFWRLPYCVNPLTCMREEIGLMWCWPFPAFMEENFEPKLSYKRFRRFSPIFF